MIKEMDKERIAFLKARDKLKYNITFLDKIIFKVFGKKIITSDCEDGICCYITAYQYRGIILIFDVIRKENNTKTKDYDTLSYKSSKG